MGRCVCCERDDNDSGITFTQGLNTATPLATVICMTCLVSAVRHMVRLAAEYADTEGETAATSPTTAGESPVRREKGTNVVLTLTEMRLIPPWLHLLAMIAMIVSTIILIWSHYG